MLDTDGRVPIDAVKLGPHHIGGDSDEQEEVPESSRNERLAEKYLVVIIDYTKVPVRIAC